MLLFTGCIVEGWPDVTVTNATDIPIVVHEQFFLDGVANGELRSYGTIEPEETASTFHVASDGDPSPWIHEYVVSIERIDGSLLWQRTYSWNELQRTGFKIIVE